MCNRLPGISFPRLKAEVYLGDWRLSKVFEISEGRKFDLETMASIELVFAFSCRRTTNNTYIRDVIVVDRPRCTLKRMRLDAGDAFIAMRTLVSSISRNSLCFYLFASSSSFVFNSSFSNRN